MKMKLEQIILSFFIALIGVNILYVQPGRAMDVKDYDTSFYGSEQQSLQKEAPLSNEQEIEEKLSVEPIADESRVKKFYEQQQQIESYLKNPVKKLEEYANFCFDELETEESFKKGKQKFKEFKNTPIKNHTKYIKYIEKYFTQKNKINNETQYFCGLYIYNLLKDTNNKDPYCNFMIGLCLSYLLTIKHSEDYSFYFGFDRQEIYDVEKTFISLTRDTLTLEKRERDSKIEEYLNKMREIHPLFEFILPIFLYGENAIFTPKTINYARSLEKSCEIFGLYPKIKRLHRRDHNPFEGMKHDYNHYHDTIYEYIEQYVYLTDTDKNEVVKQFHKTQCNLYLLIEGKESPFLSLGQKQLAHYIVMYLLRDLCFLNDDILLQLLNPEISLSDYLNQLIKNTNYHHNLIVEGKLGDENEYYNNALTLVKFFPSLEPIILFPNSEKYNLPLNLICHEILLEWFVEKAQKSTISLGL